MDHSEGDDGNKVLIIEPFYGGSHKQLIDVLMERVPSCEKYTLPAKKWHWKARTAALHFARIVPRRKCFKVLFASSVLNLAELIALRTDLAGLQKVLYFHENQLIYPIRKRQDRDFQFGYNQIISCLAADTVLFNSRYNLESFLSSIDSFLGVIPVPDYGLKGTSEQIRPKCRVLFFPLGLPKLSSLSCYDIGGCRQASECLSNLNITRKSTRGCDIREAHSSPSRLSGDCQIRDEMVRRTGTDDKDEIMTRTPRDDLATRDNSRSVLLVQEPSSDSSQVGVGACDSGDVIQHPNEVEIETDINIDCSHVMSGEQNLDHQTSSERPLHILWAHRWEHDKNPDLFFRTVIKLHDMGLDFRLSVLGEQFSDVPDVFPEAQSKLHDHIVNWGYLPSKQEYYGVLLAADVAVSTADHEFFGVAMLEAVHCGCYPLCPNRLVYPEIFPREYLYSTQQQLFKRLREFCRHPHLIRKHNLKCDVSKYSWEELRCEYLSVLDPPSKTDKETLHEEIIQPALSSGANIAMLALSPGS